MTSTDRISALKEKHADLEARLDEENRRPLPDQSEISLLKRQKLQIKDRIAELERA